MVFIFITSPLSAQFSFTNNSALLENTNITSGVAIGVTDMNGDKLDDIIRLNNGSNLFLEYQTADGHFTSYNFGEVPQDAWSLCAADVDGDGLTDLMIGGAYDNVKLIRTDENGVMFSTTLPDPGTFVQGSNFIDINNDGLVDYFACHDDGESNIWQNSGNGAFVLANDWIDMSSNSGNYGSVWTDIDNDGDNDLYIAKCRQGVNDPSDPRRINQLFLNDGNNNYYEASEAANLKIGAQSWTADFQDIDNDGDMDCFITNHDVPSQLLLNDGAGVFTDITNTSGVMVEGLPIQGMMRDFDNDGFVDIIVGGDTYQFFHNNGDLTFTEMFDVLDDDDMLTYGLGDLNNDGYVDFIGGYGEPFNNPTGIEDKLWLNDGGDNNFLGVDLIGTVSNPNGIGARIEVYGDWGMQIREVRAGESYGIMNSLKQYFGLGTSTSIDSIVVAWPSGITDMYPNLEVNKCITLIEDNCITPDVAISINGPTTLCAGETVELVAPDGYTYTWSNGITSQNLLVDIEGTYFVTVDDGSGCIGISAPVTITETPDETPAVEASGSLNICEGESVTLTSSEAAAYSWSTGDQTQSITITEAGEYSVTIPGVCSDFTSEIMTVQTFVAPNPDVMGDIIPAPGVATLTSTGTNPQWFSEPTGGTTIGAGNEFMIDITENTTFYVEDLYRFADPIFYAGKTDNAGGGNQNSPQFNGYQIFDAYEPFTILSIKTYAYGAGERTFQLTNSQGEILQSLSAIIPDGESRVELDFEVPEMTGLILRTADDPSLFRNDGGVNYPYDLDGLGAITTSNYGEEYYYYFYDWEIQEKGTECLSERISVEAIIDETLSSSNLEFENNLTIIPNPSKGFVNLHLTKEIAKDAIVVIYDISGTKVHSSTITANQGGMYPIDLGELAKGLYIIKLHNENTISNGRLIIQ